MAYTRRKRRPNTKITPLLHPMPLYDEAPTFSHFAFHSVSSFSLSSSACPSNPPLPPAMATEFPPNLDDGELWLPSDIIPEVGSLRPVSRGPGDIDALAKQLAAIGFLYPYPGPKRPVPAVKPPPDLLGGFRPATGVGFGYECYRAQPGTGAYLKGFSAVRQQFKTSTPVQPQVAGAFGPGRQRRQQQQNAGPAPCYPYRANGSGWACAGTGVFLPRVVNNEAAKRKPAVMKDGEQKQQQRAEVRKRVGGKQMQVMALSQPPPEISLPQEWTY